MKKMLRVEDFTHGDIVRIVSHESNCGIDETVLTALVTESKESGLIAIPQDFQAMLFNAVLKGTSWEMRIEWLLENDVEVFLLERYSELFDAKWT